MKTFSNIAEALADPALDIHVEVGDGKYAYVSMKDGRSYTFRHGEPWRDVIGDKFIYLLCYHLNEFRTGQGDATPMMPKALAEMVVNAAGLPRDDAAKPQPLPVPIERVIALIAKAITIDRGRGPIDAHAIVDLVCGDHNENIIASISPDVAELYHSEIKNLMRAAVVTAQARGARIPTSITEDDYAEASRAGHEAFMSCLKDKGLVR